MERGISRSEDGRSRVLDLASLRMTIAVCDFRVIAHALETHGKQTRLREKVVEISLNQSILLKKPVCTW